MARFEISSIAIFVIALTISIQQASALKCWNCKSKEHAFCSADWDSSKVSEFDKLYYYTTCYGKVCMTALKHDGDVFKGAVRACAVNEELAQLSCENLARENGYTNVKVNCTTCNSDGCNGDGPVASGNGDTPGGSGGAAQYDPIALLIALPVAIVKLLSI